MLERVGDPITPRFLTAQMARLNANFGNPKDRTADQVRIMASEWFEALSGFGTITVRQAFDKIIRTWVPSFGRTWPSLAEVHALCAADHEGWHDALQLAKPKAHVRDEEPFCREGRTEAEEIAYRVAKLKEIKASLPFTPAFDYEPTDTIEPAKPALADDGYVSPALEEIARKRGYWRGAR